MPVLDSSENKQAKNPNHGRKPLASEKTCDDIGSIAVEMHKQQMPYEAKDGLSLSLSHTKSMKAPNFNPQVQRHVSRFKTRVRKPVHFKLCCV